MTRIEAISGQTAQTESVPVAERDVEQYEIGRELKGDVVAKANAERLKNVPKDVIDEYEAARDTMNALTLEHDEFSKMTREDKSIYLECKKIMEDLEAQYPELNAQNYYAKIASSSQEDIPIQEQPEPSEVAAAEIPSDTEAPAANENGFLKKALKFAVFGPIVAPLIPDKDEPLAKSLVKAPLGVLGWFLP